MYKFAAAGKQSNNIATATVQPNCTCAPGSRQSGRVLGQGANTWPRLQLHTSRRDEINSFLHLVNYSMLTSMQLMLNIHYCLGILGMVLG